MKGHTMKRILTYLLMFAIAVLLYMCTVYQIKPVPVKCTIEYRNGTVLHYYYNK